MMLFAPDINTLKMFVQFLNGRYRPSMRHSVRTGGTAGLAPDQLEVRRLVQAWFDSGQDPKKLLQSEQALAHDSRNIRACLVPGTHYARLAILDIGTRDVRDPLSNAFGIFILFLLNPENRNLCGPCPQCGEYFIKKSDRKRVYCSKSCGHKHSGVVANRRLRANERRQQLMRAAEYGALWEKAKTSLSWIKWVSKKADISKHLLTRALRSGEISEPKKANS